MKLHKKNQVRQWKIIFSLPLFFILFLTSNVAVSQPSQQKTNQPIKQSETKQAKPDSQFKKKLMETIAKAEKSFNDEFDAEVWLFEQAKRLEKVASHIPENERFTILRLVHREANKFNLDPMMVLALINVESDFDQYAISSAGALGLMQVMPFWKKEIGKPSDNLNEIETNLRYGCAILSQYLKREKNDSTMALGRYNGSRGQYWYPERIYKAMRKVWHP